MTSDEEAVNPAEKRYRVALYVREPDLRIAPETNRREEGGTYPTRMAPSDAQIEKGIRVLELQGWRDVQFNVGDWDDDFQSGKAYYIYTSSLAPAGREADAEAASFGPVNAVICVNYRPEHCVPCNADRHESCVRRAGGHDADVRETDCLCACGVQGAFEG